MLIAPISLPLPQQTQRTGWVVVLKSTLTASQAILKQDGWIETTVVSLKDEENFCQMNHCNHGTDGKMQTGPSLHHRQDQRSEACTARLPNQKRKNGPGKHLFPVFIFSLIHHQSLIVSN